MNENFNPNQKVRVIVGTVIMVTIAAIHFFRIGSYLNGNLYILYYSFASDMMLPFGAYFMLCMNEIRLGFLRKWYTKALIVFGVMTFSEVMQLFGVYFFGVTFDILDILAFGIGTFIAVFFDKLIFQSFILRWKLNSVNN